jgi:hypothetical protein
MARGFSGTSAFLSELCFAVLRRSTSPDTLAFRPRLSLTPLPTRKSTVVSDLLRPPARTFEIILSVIVPELTVTCISPNAVPRISSSGAETPQQHLRAYPF